MKVKQLRLSESYWPAKVGEIVELRKQGYTLQSIGSRMGVTKQRISFVLKKYYGKTEIPNLIPRYKLARLIGCSNSTITRLERKGLLHPIHIGYMYLYNKNDIEEVKELIKSPPLPDPTEKICEECGIKFYRRPSYIRECSPGRFCSNICQGRWLGKNYGFGRK